MVANDLQDRTDTHVLPVVRSRPDIMRAEAEELIAWTPTTQLRAVTKWIMTGSSGSGYEGVNVVIGIEQRYVGDNGAERWVRIPEVKA